MIDNSELINRFNLLVRESKGQQYQDLFTKIMGYADSSFHPVKASGNIGDRGNDGWCEDTGKYYQVYAPEDLSKKNNNAIKKMKEDFEKITKYWNKISPVKEYIFVVNDKFDGVSPQLCTEINKLKEEYNNSLQEEKNKLQKVSIFLANDLRNLLFSQNQDVIYSIVGYTKEENKIYHYLIDEITEKMFLNKWLWVSDNLISNAIQSNVVDGFNDAIALVGRTSFPCTIKPLEESIIEMVNRAKVLINHFTESKFAYLYEYELWRIDMRWKGIKRYTEIEYNEKYENCEVWRKQLFALHWNLVYALNSFSNEVRLHIYPNYLKGRKFTVLDSQGLYNNLQYIEWLPDRYVDYADIN